MKTVFLMQAQTSNVAYVDSGYFAVIAAWAGEKDLAL
jgi:hypothetical protein